MSTQFKIQQEYVRLSNQFQTVFSGRDFVLQLSQWRSRQVQRRYQSARDLHFFARFSRHGGDWERSLPFTHSRRLCNKRNSQQGHQTSLQVAEIQRFVWIVVDSCQVSAARHINMRISWLVVLALGVILVEPSLGEDKKFQQNVVGGANAVPGQFPYFAAGNGCGASLIWKDIAISAAHCAGFFDDTLIVGSTFLNQVVRCVQNICAFLWHWFST